MNKDDADILCEVIGVMEEFCPLERVSTDLEALGYPRKDVDRALKALGKIAGRDMGWED